MVKKLRTLLPPHDVYIEPFFGAGHLFFAKERVRLEIINDLDGDLVNFYRVVAYHSAELEAWLRFLPHSRQTWTDLERQPRLTDIQRAVLWFWKSRVSFSGKGSSFGVHRSSVTRVKPVMRDFTEIAQRLESVIIEQRPIECVLDYYDSREAFFFLDPPYVGTSQEAYDTPTWGLEQQEAFLKLLGSLQGRWLLTVGGEITREALEPIAEYIEEHEVTYSVGGGKAGRVRRGEFIAANYRPGKV
jgi:DNA adenine methylase